MDKANADKKPLGRPSTFDSVVAAAICERLAEGEPLRQICRDESMPAWRTVYGWLASNEDFSARFASARELGFDAIAEETLEMIDETPEREETKFGSKIDGGSVSWQKNRVEQRMKLLAKWSPKRYGDKMAIGGADDLPAIKTIADDSLDAKIAALMAKQINERADEG